MRRRARTHAYLVTYRKIMHGLKRTVQSAHDKHVPPYIQRKETLRCIQQLVPRLMREHGEATT